jgi:lactate dehydrogenase-like 2-hydroxyacid dehydrogenase
VSKPRVIITRRWPKEAEARASALFDVQLNEQDRPMSPEQLRDCLRNADGVCPTVSDAIDAEVLSASPLRCKILGNFGVGFNNIDVAAAKMAGIVVTNTPEVLTECTADLAMTLLLSVARRSGEGERHVRSGAWAGWRPTHMMGTAVTGKTLGLIGMGRIARAMARKAHLGFGMKIVFTDPFPPPQTVVDELGASACDSIEEVLEQSDFVSLHCPGGASTHHLMDAERFAKMKPTAFLVNSARGDVVETRALIDALRSGRIAGAALDVFEGEPAVPDELTLMENVVLLPHLGSATHETRVAMGLRALENLRAFFEGESPRDRVT